MAGTKNDIDLTDKAQLELFLKESGIASIIGAMKKDAPIPETSPVQPGKGVAWIVDLVRTFQPCHINLRSHYVVLPKLLEYLTKETFTGFLLIRIKSTISIMFMYNGDLNGIINDQLDLVDEELFRYIVENYEDAAIDMYSSPEDKGALPLILNSAVRDDIEPIYKDLDTEFTDLLKLITKLEGEKFTGHIQMNTSEGTFIACYFKGREVLIISLTNTMTCSASSREDMLNTSGVVNIYASIVRTVVSSMDDVMSRITVNVSHHDTKAPTLNRIVDGYHGHISLNMAEGARDNVYLKVILPAGLAGRDNSEFLLAQIYKTREFRFIKYFFLDFLLNIAETGSTVSLKNIWNYIPSVRVIKFKQKYYLGHLTHDFDILMYDGSGRLLFAARFTDRAPTSYEVDMFLKQLENIKRNENEWNSIKGGFYISTSGFEDSAFTAAQKASAGSGVKSMLGTVGGLKVSERLASQKGFIKSGTDDGFHLNLIHQKQTAFEMVFPEL